MSGTRRVAAKLLSIRGLLILFAAIYGFAIRPGNCAGVQVRMNGRGRYLATIWFPLPLCSPLARSRSQDARKTSGPGSCRLDTTGLGSMDMT